MFWIGVSAWRALGAVGSAEKCNAKPRRRAYSARGEAGEKTEMGVGDRAIERLKLVLGAAGWKAFMAEVAASRGRDRDAVVRR